MSVNLGAASIGAGPATVLRAVTPSDSTDLAVGGVYPRALYVGGYGTLSIMAVGDVAAVSLVGIPGGSIIPIAAKNVMVATTATLIVALY